MSHVITLDWDNISYQTCARRIAFMLNNPLIETIELRVSPSLDGFHCYVECFIENPSAVFRLRRDWKDDGIRVCTDFASPRAIYRNVMFVYKSSPLGRMNETPIVKYYRHKGKWKWQSLRKNQSQMSSQALPSCLVSLKALSTENPPRLTL